jgi:hypothetical protein
MLKMHKQAKKIFRDDIVKKDKRIIFLDFYFE